MSENHTATDSEALKKAFYPAPERPEDWPAWRENLIKMRDRLHLPKPVRDVSAQKWASRAYGQGFIMLWDNELIDHATGTWQVNRLLDRAERQFGGYDVVVLWNNYPLSGIDERHQFAYFDLLPGGRQGLREAVAQFHRRGVKVMIDHKPWVPGLPEGVDNEGIAFETLLKDADLDGIYLDCSSGPSPELLEAAKRVGPDKAFCSEAPACMEPFGQEAGSWLQMTDDSINPGMYRNRWLDRDHMVYESRRYFHDPILEVQRGWMNGGGFCIWENVFGYWAAYSERVCSWLRLVLPAQRRFADWFVGGEWSPHVGGGTNTRTSVTQWEWQGLSLWTVVNRRSHDLEKNILKLPYISGARYFDIITGRELSIGPIIDNVVALFGKLDREGIHGIFAVQDIDLDFENFLATQRRCYAEAKFNVEHWTGEHRKTELPHLLQLVHPTQRAKHLPSGMCELQAREGLLETQYRQRECGYIAGHESELHVYDAFEKICRDYRPAKIEHIAIDEAPVTNAEFKTFLEQSGYVPKISESFLKHWVNGLPPVGQTHHPVVYVSLGDARAYAKWAGKRLPREEEWQWAAQGPENLNWPWGNQFEAQKCNTKSAGTCAVDAHPEGRSPIGCLDMCGNTWEWCESERSDGHTRYVILKGGSYLDHGEGSFWLFDGGPKPANWGAKLILLHDGWDRCATIGFRCAIDLE